jgi:hypothetical protein
MNDIEETMPRLVAAGNAKETKLRFLRPTPQIVSHSGIRIT